MKTIYMSLLALLLVLAGMAPAQAQQATGSPELAKTHQATKAHEDETSAYVKTPPAPYAQWLVDQTVAAHEAVKALEMAVELDDTCRTIAATDEEDLGERCDEDEIGPMKSGKPGVENPSEEDPVYDFTLALHDAQGTLIGALGIDLASEGLSHDQALELAQKVLAKVEAKISTKDLLFAPAPVKREAVKPH